MKFTPEVIKDVKPVLYTWWADLHDPKNDGQYADRAELARLRRIDVNDYGEGPVPDIVEALTIKSFRNLLQSVNRIDTLRDEQEYDLVIVAAALARIRKDDRAEKQTAALLGGREDKDRLVKEARFLQLMRTQTPGDLFNQACRLTKILKQAAPVNDLAASLLLWRHTPKVRRDWARAYYHLDQYAAETSAPVETLEIGA